MNAPFSSLVFRILSQSLMANPPYGLLLDLEQSIYLAPCRETATAIPLHEFTYSRFAALRSPTTVQWPPKDGDAAQRMAIHDRVS